MVSVSSAQTAQQSQWKVPLTLSIFSKDILEKIFIFLSVKTHLKTKSEG